MIDPWCNHDPAAVVSNICECGVPTAGKWVVFTVTSIYVIDLDNMTAQRNPGAPNEDWGDGYAVAQLRLDGDQIKLLHLDRLTIGQPMSLILSIRDDGVSTVRTTTPVQTIVPNPEEQS